MNAHDLRVTVRALRWALQHDAGGPFALGDEDKVRRVTDELEGLAETLREDSTDELVLNIEVVRS